MITKDDIKEGAQFKMLGSTLTIDKIDQYDEQTPRVNSSIGASKYADTIEKIVDILNENEVQTFKPKQMKYDKNTPPNPHAKKPVICRLYPRDVKTQRTEPNPQVIQWFRLQTTVFNRSVILN